MYRPLVLVFLLVPQLSTGRPKKRHAKIKPVPAAALTLKLESVNLPQARAQVLITGLRRAPEPRYFVFRDERARRFIALDLHCEPVGRALRCTLDLPRPYLRAKIVALTLEMGHRSVAADDVARFFGPASSDQLPAATTDHPELPVPVEEEPEKE